MLCHMEKMSYTDFMALATVAPLWQELRPKNMLQV